MIIASILAIAGDRTGNWLTGEGPAPGGSDPGAAQGLRSGPSPRRAAIMPRPIPLLTPVDGARVPALAEVAGRGQRHKIAFSAVRSNLKSGHHRADSADPRAPFGRCRAGSLPGLSWSILFLWASTGATGCGCLRAHRTTRNAGSPPTGLRAMRGPSLTASPRRARRAGSPFTPNATSDSPYRRRAMPAGSDRRLDRERRVPDMQKLTAQGLDAICTDRPGSDANLSACPDRLLGRF